MEQENETANPEGARRRPWRRLVLAGGLLLLLLLLSIAAAYLVQGYFLPSDGPRPVALRPTVRAATPPPTADAAVVAALPGRIAFVNRSGQVGTVAPSGADERLLTPGADSFIFPSWSPDGSAVAAIGAGERGAGIFLLTDDEDGQPVPLYFSEQDPPIYLYWSPDGSQLTFIARYDGELGLYLTPVQGERDSRLLLSGQSLYWDWAPEGDVVLVHSGGHDDAAQLGLVDLQEGELAESMAQPGYFQVPGVSHDGHYLAYGDLDEARARWLVVRDRASGDTVERLPHAGALALGWSPVADQLAFISAEFRGGVPQFDYYGPLRLFDVQSGEVRLLSPQQVLAFFWSPDGQSIATITLTDGVDELRASLPADNRFARRSRGAAQHGTGPLRLTLSVVDVDSGKARPLLDFRPADVFVSQFLPYFDQYSLSHRLWSPDSQALVLPIVEQGEAVIVVVPLAGGGARRVAEGSAAFWSPVD